MDKMKKPIILKIDEARTKIADIINNLYADGIPYYIIEPFFAELKNQIKNNAIAEIKEAQRVYSETDIEEDNTIEEKTEET